MSKEEKIKELVKGLEEARQEYGDDFNDLVLLIAGDIIYELGR